MAHTRPSSIKKKIYILRTNNYVAYTTNSNVDDSNLVDSENSIKIVTETQTQVAKATLVPKCILQHLRLQQKNLLNSNDSSCYWRKKLGQKIKHYYYSAFKYKRGIRRFLWYRCISN